MRLEGRWVLEQKLSELVFVVKVRFVSTGVTFPAQFGLLNVHLHFWIFAFLAQDVFLNEFVNESFNIFIRKLTVDNSLNVVPLRVICHLRPQVVAKKFQRICKKFANEI
jgi:hypothetical protein